MDMSEHAKLLPVEGGQRKCIDEPAAKKKKGPVDHLVASGGAEGDQLVLPTPAEKKKMAQAVATWIAKSSRPFDVVEDHGLAQVVQTAINFGYD